MFRYRVPSILLLYGIFSLLVMEGVGKGEGRGGEGMMGRRTPGSSRTELSILCYCSDSLIVA